MSKFKGRKIKLLRIPPVDQKEVKGMEIGQIIDTVGCPAEHKHKNEMYNSIWIQGATEPIRLLNREYELIP